MKAIMKKVLYISSLLFLLAAAFPLQGQVIAERKVRFGIIVDGDTLPYYHLKEIHIIESGSLLTETEIRKNQKLIRNVKKMLPYAKIGKQRLDILEKQIAGLPKKERRAAIKAAEKNLLADFSDELKDCTISQGKVLLKLIDRETSMTSYEVIELYKGTFVANLWQMVAKAVGNDLKEEYDGADKDQITERIITLVEAGQL
jgi:hypothetical protein